jgi:hypothetical protein
MPIGPGQPGYPWTRASILANAPRASGVYVIYNGQTWIYVGESGDIQARLLQHFNGDNPCITHYVPTGFQFELVAAVQRVARQDEWIAHLGPACNQRFG